MTGNIQVTVDGECNECDHSVSHTVPAAQEEQAIETVREEISSHGNAEHDGDGSMSISSHIER
jgi:hypothetical protein